MLKKITEYQKKEKYKDIKIGSWCGDQRQNYKNNKLSEEKIKQLERIPEWYWKK